MAGMGTLERLRRGEAGKHWRGKARGRERAREGTREHERARGEREGEVARCRIGAYTHRAAHMAAV